MWDHSVQENLTYQHTDIQAVLKFSKATNTECFLLIQVHNPYIYWKFKLMTD